MSSSFLAWALAASLGDLRFPVLETYGCFFRGADVSDDEDPEDLGVDVLTEDALFGLVTTCSMSWGSCLVTPVEVPGTASRAISLVWVKGPRNCRKCAAWAFLEAAAMAAALASFSA